jgi:hypothetical protein
MMDARLRMHDEELLLLGLKGSDDLTLLWMLLPVLKTTDGMSLVMDVTLDSSAALC